MKKVVFILLLLAPFAGSGQVITTVAGNGTHGFWGDGGAATAAELFAPKGIAFDNSGNLYIADFWNNRIRKVDTSGIITTIAGTGTGWYNGDGGPAIHAQLYLPIDLCIDSKKNIFISDLNNFQIRKIDSLGIISTIAGNGTWGYSGDNGAATAAQVISPGGICVDTIGNIYFCDVWNYRVRKVDTDGIIHTIAGNGVAASIGDGSPATAASLNAPGGLCFDLNGNLFITEQSGNRIRKVDTNGIISTIAGSGTEGYSGDGGPATAAQFFGPGGICIDGIGNLYVSDHANHAIRIIDTSGIIHTFAGTGTAGYNGDGILAATAQLNSPALMCMDKKGYIYIADQDNNRIRKISTPDVSITSRVSFTTTQLKVYPNPAQDQLHIEHATPNTTYHVYNIVGGVMLRGVLQANENTISLHSLPPGMYLLQLTDEGKRTVHKIIKE
jgi:sugar lactone lactonase YvrE